MILRIIATLVIGCLGLASAQSEESLRLVEVRKIWDRAPHNAFTDLIHQQGRWFCVFREGHEHVSPDGALRVITSNDGVEWTSAAFITSPDSDLRDAKIVVTPVGRLMLSGAEALHKRENQSHQSLAWFSDDGFQWSKPVPIGDPDYWLWRITWHRGQAFSIGYSCTSDRNIRLYRSSDGKNFEVIADSISKVGYPNETSIVFDEDTAYCLLRRDGEPSDGQFGTARAPFTDWTWKSIGVPIGGPHMVRMSDGRFLAAVRLYDHKVRTSLGWIDPVTCQFSEALTLPSGGDCSYAGLVVHEDELWVSYYSSHEGKTGIYLARVAISGD